jgi:hypothetical protein
VSRIEILALRSVVIVLAVGSVVATVMVLRDGRSPLALPLAAATLMLYAYLVRMKRGLDE